MGDWNAGVTGLYIFYIILHICTIWYIHAFICTMLLSCLYFNMSILEGGWALAYYLSSKVPGHSKFVMVCMLMTLSKSTRAWLWSKRSQGLGTSDHPPWRSRHVSRQVGGWRGWWVGCEEHWSWLMTICFSQVQSEFHFQLGVVVVVVVVDVVAVVAVVVVVVVVVVIATWNLSWLYNVSEASLAQLALHRWPCGYWVAAIWA